MGFEKVSTHSHMSRQPDPPGFFLKRNIQMSHFVYQTGLTLSTDEKKKTIDPLTPTPGRLPDATNGKWH